MVSRYIIASLFLLGLFGCSGDGGTVDDKDTGTRDTASGDTGSGDSGSGDSGSGDSGGDSGTGDGSTDGSIVFDCMGIGAVCGKESPCRKSDLTLTCHGSNDVQNGVCQKSSPTCSAAELCAFRGTTCVHQDGAKSGICMSAMEKDCLCKNPEAKNAYTEACKPVRGG